MKILTSRKFHQRRKGNKKPKPGSKNYVTIFEKILHFVNKGEKIIFVLGYGHHKNFKICRTVEPDQAEIMSLKFLMELAEEIRFVYSPGITIYLVTTGARAEFANDSEEVDSLKYHNALLEIINKNTDFSRVFKLIMLKDIWEKYSNFPQILDEQLRGLKTETIEENEIKDLIRRAKRNNKNKIDDYRALESAMKYRATFLAERELCMWEEFFSKEVIICSYRVNHLISSYILLYTIKKGLIIQPWEGFFEEKTKTIITKKEWFIRTLTI